MHKNIAIKVSNLTKTYKLYSQPIDRLKEALNPFGKKYHRNFNAVKNLSFEIKKGETVGIIGRNGCGKSTLLKMIARVLTPSSGRVTVHGHISAILELGAGFNPEMTGHENVYLNTSINGLTKDQTDQKIEEIIKFSELGDFIYQPIKTYSSGMKARLAFAVAINVEPDILIVDEALSVGDAAFQRKCFAKMEEIREKGATVLFVSHSEASIVSLCNRAIWINNGELVLDGIPKLVTGLYLKKCNSKQIDKKIICEEYNKLVEDNKKEFNPESNTNKKNEQNIAETYNPKLRSVSAIYYDKNGAWIYDITVENLYGKKVNMLVQENNYKIKVQIEIYKKLNDVRFGIAIKDIKGNYFSGAALELLKNRQIKNLDIGKYCIEWDFSCFIVEGIYVIDVVILDEFNANRNITHKINDSYLFKVSKIEKDNIIQSHVPMIKSCTYYEVS